MPSSHHTWWSEENSRRCTTLMSPSRNSGHSAGKVCSAGLCAREGHEGEQCSVARRFRNKEEEPFSAGCQHKPYD